VAAFASRGLSLDLQLFAPYGDGRGPVRAKYAGVPPEWSVLCPMREVPYRYFVREVTRRYGGHARFFQIGNEPSNEFQYKGTPEDYVASFRQAKGEIRRLLPNAEVTNGGYCNTSDGALRIATGVRGQTDFVSYHCHDYLPGLRAFFAQVQDMQRAGGRGRRAVREHGDGPGDAHGAG